MNSGVPHVTVFGLVIFSLFINDLELGVTSEVAKFVDKTKSPNGWGYTLKWQMRFSVNECKVIHMGANNINFTYTQMEFLLTVLDQERDLGVVVHSSMKIPTHCVAAVKKANFPYTLITRGLPWRTSKMTDFGILLNLVYWNSLRATLEIFT